MEIDMFDDTYKSLQYAKGLTHKFFNLHNIKILIKQAFDILPKKN